jgi:hypothetical protein
MDQILASIDTITKQKDIGFLDRVEVCLVDRLGHNGLIVVPDNKFDVIWAVNDQDDSIENAHKVGLEETSAEWVVFLHPDEMLPLHAFSQWWEESAKTKKNYVVVNPYTMFIRR